MCSSERARLLWNGRAVLVKHAAQICSLSHEALSYSRLQKHLQCVAPEQTRVLFSTGIIDVILNVNAFQFYSTREGCIRLASLCKSYQRCIQAHTVPSTRTIDVVLPVVIGGGH